MQIYLHGPLGQFLSALWFSLDERDVERRGQVSLLWLQKSLNNSQSGGAGVPWGSDRRLSPALALFLLTPQRHRHHSCQQLWSNTEAVPSVSQKSWSRAEELVQTSLPFWKCLCLCVSVCLCVSCVVLSRLLSSVCLYILWVNGWLLINKVRKWRIKRGV